MKCKEKARTKPKVKSLKFKTTRHVFISEELLPTKGSLLKICKEELFIDFTAFGFDNLPGVKDKIVLAIYITSKVLEQLGKPLKSRDDLN